MAGDRNVPGAQRRRAHDDRVVGGRRTGDLAQQPDPGARRVVGHEDVGHGNFCRLAAAANPEHDESRCRVAAGGDRAIAERGVSVAPAQIGGGACRAQSPGASEVGQERLDPRVSAKSSAAGTPTATGSDQRSAGTRDTSIRRAPPRLMTRTAAGRRPSCVHPIFRYPGRLLALGVLNTKSTPSRRRSSIAARVSRRKMPRPC